MRTIAQNIKKTVVGCCLGFLLVPGPLSLCQAQGGASPLQSGLDLPAIAPIQSSAPALGGWECSAGGGGELAGLVEIREGNPERYLPTAEIPSAPPVTPLTGGAAVPLLSQPEPSSISLMLAGSAVLLRLGRRKRSN
ncbi:MAG: PEP-CTERM sorting domain-containing protein [Verrucomicrobiota bacterium]